MVILKLDVVYSFGFDSVKCHIYGAFVVDMNCGGWNYCWKGVVRFVCG